MKFVAGCNIVDNNATLQYTISMMNRRKQKCCVDNAVVKRLEHFGVSYGGGMFKEAPVWSVAIG